MEWAEKTKRFLLLAVDNWIEFSSYFKVYSNVVYLFFSFILISFKFILYFQYECKVQNLKKRKVTLHVSVDGVKISLKKKKRKVSAAVNHRFNRIKKDKIESKLLISVSTSHIEMILSFVYHFILFFVEKTMVGWCERHRANKSSNL